MTMRWFIILILLLAPTNHSAIADNALAPNPFAAAAALPAEVSLYFHVENAAAIRAEVADRPLDQWISSILRHGQIAEVWSGLGGTVGLEPEALFDACLGRSFTLVCLPRADSGDPTAPNPPARWVLLTEIDPIRTQPLLDRLKLKRLRPWFGRAVAELPEHELLFCMVENQLMIGPKQAPKLFWQLVPGLGDPRSNSLAESEPVAEAAKLGPGCVGLVIRHDPPLGGWSAMVADLVGDRISIKHAGRFASAPFERSVTETTWDASPIHAIEDSALVVVMEPSDIGGGSTGAYLESQLGRALISPQMRPNLGDARVYTLGEVEGRLQETPSDLLPSTFGLIIPLRNTEDAEGLLDRSMLDLSARLNELHGGELISEVPAREELPPGRPRCINLNPTVELFGGAMPVMQQVSVNWAFVQGKDAGYYVLATHPDHLDATVKALKQTREVKPETGRWTSCGSANGQRLGVHLRSYGDQAALFNAGDPADAMQFRQTMLMLSELASGINRCRWRLARPSTNEMRLDVELILSPSRSSH